MANLSNIILPDATSVILKDNSQSKSDHRHDSTNIVPIVHKLYESTSYYATAANQGASTWYVASVKPDSWYLPWKIKFKFHTYCPNYPAYESVTYSMITGRSTGVSYANWNEIQTTAHYYINIYPLTAAGFNAGYGFAIGIGIYAATDYTKAAYYRSFEVDFLECENCTVNVLDTPVKWADWPGTGTTNYGTLVSTNGYSRGLQETGDANTVTDNRISYFAGKTGVRGVWATSLFMEDGVGRFQNICMGSDATETSLGTRTVNATKIPNSNGFKVGSSIWYTTTTYADNTNISGASVILSSISIFDSRYSFNTSLVANSLIPYNLLYLVGTIHDDNLYYLDDVWWTQTPNDPNKVYVLVGSCFDSTTSYCRITLYEQNKWYRYDGTNLVEFTYGATTLVSKGSMLPIGNTAPYLFRQSGGDNNAYVGTEETDSLVGASAVVNQLANPSSFNSENGITKPTIDDNGIISIGGTTTSTYSRCFNRSITLKGNHVYAVLHKQVTNPNNLPFFVSFFNASGISSNGAVVYRVSSNTPTGFGVSQLTNHTDYSGVSIYMGYFDLTAMFGTAIADYIYSLEQATAGSGIAYLHKYGFFTKDYYPYTANALQSVNTSKHSMVGRNLFDKTAISDNKRLTTTTGQEESANNYCVSDYIYVRANFTYYIANPQSARCWFYDVNKNPTIYDFLGTSRTFTPTTDGYIRVTIYKALVNVDTYQINIGSAAVSYEPYIKHEYALPNIDLRGLYKLDASNNLYADGDTLEGDGTLTRKYGIVDLGQFTWRKVSGAWVTNYQAIPNFKQVKSYYAPINCLCKSYITGTANSAPQKDKEITFTINSSYPLIRDDEYASATPSEFKNHMSGIYLIYELETPTTETATGFTNPQLVDKYGTEEYTDERDFPLPVGHETIYLSELYGDREKLDSLPNRANADGTYAVSQTFGQMTLVPTSEISVGDAETVDGYTISTTSIGSASTGTAFTLPKAFSTTNIPNISKKTVVTSASGATAAYANGILTFTNGLFETGDSVIVGTPIAAYTGISSTETVPNISVETKTVATATRDES